MVTADFMSPQKHTLMALAGQLSPGMVFQEFGLEHPFPVTVTVTVTVRLR
jgi:hypothetical protein